METPSRRFDAGDMGCGELVMRLATMLDAMSPGERLDVRSTSPGSGSDLPAWCRMRGHTLVRVDPPLFLIERG
ncbi:MAG: sulfurtransferase TusA family protein [Phycisphaerales bacterium]|nr:sulfurtransferase TusA family protein [Phycisphaerales bacterium]